MKITAKQIEPFLSKPQAYRGVLLHGPDEGMVREFRKDVLKNVAGSEDDPFCITELTQDQVVEDPSQLFSSLSSMSLMGGNPVTFLRNVTDKITSHLKEAMEIESCSNYFVLCAGDLGSKSSLRSLCEKDKRIASVGCYPDEGRSLEQIIRSFFSERKIQSGNDTIRYLASMLGNDRSITLSELEKIDLFLGEERILNHDLLEILISDNTLRGLDEISYCVLDANPKELGALCEKVFLDGQNPVAVLRSVSRYTDRILTIRDSMKQGLSAEQAVDSIRPPVFFKTRPALVRHVSKNSDQRLRHIQSALLRAELACKRTSSPQTICLQSLTSMACSK